MGVWFDKIARGEKTVEHRAMSKRNVEVVFAWLRRGPPYVVRLRRGYTKISLKFQVPRVDINVTDEMFDIHLGARI